MERYVLRMKEMELVEQLNQMKVERENIRKEKSGMEDELAQILIVVHLLQHIFGYEPAGLVFAQEVELPVLDLLEAVKYDSLLVLKLHLLQLKLLNPLFLVFQAVQFVVFDHLADI